MTPLSEWLAAGMYAYFLVFCRIGTAVMVMPGIGETYVPPRSRLLFALSMSVLLAPLLAAGLPGPPLGVGTLMAQMGGEILVGLFMGGIARVMISAANTAGTVIATESGLASAMMLDVTQTSQATPVTNLISILAVTLFFATDLDHVLLMGLRESYSFMPATHFPPVADIVQYLTTAVSHAFDIGVRLAAPQIVISLLLYLGAGVVARLMPSMQVFFILMAPQILLSFFILMVTLSGTMMWYMHYLDGVFMNFPNIP